MRLSILLTALLSSTALAAPNSDQGWSQWRGPLGTGAAPAANPPLKWSDSENIRWKVEVPGAGNGSPVVWEDRVYVMTAIPFGEEIEVDEGESRGRMKKIVPNRKQRFTLLAYNRKDGSLAWQSVAIEKLPHEGTHGDGTWAPASPVTDGEHIFAHFGSRGLHAFDMDGKKLWEKQFGEMTTRNGFGEGASPALWGDTIVVQWDHEGPSFIAALDKNTGEELWRRERDEVTSWATPLITTIDGKAQVIANGTTRIRGYDLLNGETLWECGGMTTNAIPTPVLHDDRMVYVMSGFRGSKLVAIDLKQAQGDITDGDAVVWSLDRNTPYVPSPLLLDDTLYFLKSNSGILTAVNRKTGELVFGPQRLEGVANAYASPVGAAGRVYVVDREGTTEVIEHGSEYKVLATNVLSDNIDASPALIDDELYLRGAKYLYCISESK